MSHPIVFAEVHGGDGACGEVHEPGGAEVRVRHRRPLAAPFTPPGAGLGPFVAKPFRSLVHRSLRNPSRLARR
jgi:hypothetical protein